MVLCMKCIFGSFLLRSSLYSVFPSPIIVVSGWREVSLFRWSDHSRPNRKFTHKATFNGMFTTLVLLMLWIMCTVSPFTFTVHYLSAPRKETFGPTLRLRYQWCSNPRRPPPTRGCSTVTSLAENLDCLSRFEGRVSAHAVYSHSTLWTFRMCLSILLMPMRRWLRIKEILRQCFRLFHRSLCLGPSSLLPPVMVCWVLGNYRLFR